MQTANFPSFNKYKSQHVNWLQDKFDGHLAKIIKGYVTCRVFTKNDNEITAKYMAVPHIRDILNGLPANTQVFAELHHPDKFATDVPTLLNAADPSLRLTAFAVPWLYGMSLADFELSDAMASIGRYMDFAYATRLKKQLTKQEIKTLLASAESQHLEGFVLKRGHLDGWYKLKPLDDIDAFVTGTKMSTSASYFGLLKSVRGGVWQIDPVTGERTVYDLGDVPGFKKAVIQEFDTPEKRATLIGRVLKIEYSGRAAKGKLKWPHFAGWRTDKNAEDCTFSQFK